MESALAKATLNLGFLSIMEEGNSYLGGYLVTNAWSRPLEFRVSTAVELNRVQQILYGENLRPYVCADVIGKTLVEKTAATVHLIVTDSAPVLELRRSVSVPVAWLISREGPSSADSNAPALALSQGRFLCHPHYGADLTSVRGIMGRLPAGADLAEPFDRIREAIAEARKMGMTARR